jgi:hypothetical protein
MRRDRKLRVTDAAAIRRALRPHARRVQTAAAVVGFLALLAALLQLPYDGGPPPPWIRRFFVAWCVAVPYWHYLEHAFLLERDESDRPTGDALRLQRLSQAVWLGGALAIAAFVAGG